MKDRIDLLVVGGLLVIDHIAVLDELPAPGGATLFPGLTRSLSSTFYGGNNVNVAAAAAALGLRVGLVCFTGEDFESSGYRAHLDAIGIKDRWLQVLHGQDIAHCYSFFDRHGTSLTFMDFPGEESANELQISDAVIESAGQVVISGGRRDDLSAGRMLEIAATAHKAGVPVALAWAGDKSNFEPAYFDLADTLLCNHFESEVILECLGLDAEDGIAKIGPKRIFVTRGAGGSELYHDGRMTKLPAVPPDAIVDPTGAGDAYAGGVLAGLAWGKPPDVCGKIGAVVSSFVLEKRGCQTNLPSRTQLEARYQSVFGETLNSSAETR